MSIQEMKMRLEQLEQQAKKANEEISDYKKTMQALVKKNSEYREQLIECGYLV